MKQILGQQGDKSNARKLFAWLKNWHKNQKGPVKPARPSMFQLSKFNCTVFSHYRYMSHWQ